MLDDNPPLIFMRFCLKCLGIERFGPVQRFLYIFRLMSDIGVCPVFRKHQLIIRETGFQIFYPRLNSLYIFLIPPEITVHSLYIGISIYRMFHMPVSVYGNRIPVRVFRLSDIVQLPGQSSRVCSRSIHFIV